MGQVYLGVSSICLALSDSSGMRRPSNVSVFALLLEVSLSNRLIARKREPHNGMHFSHNRSKYPVDSGPSADLQGGKGTLCMSKADLFVFLALAPMRRLDTQKRGKGKTRKISKRPIEGLGVKVRNWTQGCTMAWTLEYWGQAASWFVLSFPL